MHGKSEKNISSLLPVVAVHLVLQFCIIIGIPKNQLFSYFLHDFDIKEKKASINSVD